MSEEEKNEKMTEESTQVQESIKETAKTVEQEPVQEQVNETEQPEQTEAEEVSEKTNLTEEKSEVQKDAKMSKKSKEKAKKSPKEAKKPREKKQKVKEVEEKEDDFNSLSDDEKYARIQTEKLLKKRKQKQIFTICGFCVAFVFALTLIVLACVPVSLKPSCISGGFQDVTFFTNASQLNDGTNAISSTEDPEKYAEFMKLYNETFNQTCLTAIFSGSLGGEKIKEDYNNFKYKSAFGTFGSLAGSNVRLIRFRYAQPKSLKKNGKKYVSTEVPGDDFNIEFTDAFLAVTNERGLRDVTVYVVVQYPQSSDKNYITVTLRADTSKLYDAWTDFA